MMKMPNFKLGAEIGEGNCTVEEDTKGVGGNLVVRIYQPKDGDLHQAVKVECIPMSDGWYKSTVFIDGEEVVSFESNERCCRTFTRKV